jgi:hypothetical protein
MKLTIIKEPGYSIRIIETSIGKTLTTMRPECYGPFQLMYNIYFMLTFEIFEVTPFIWHAIFVWHETLKDADIIKIDNRKVTCQIEF